ncbi:MAG: methylmalonyl-CoA epimerase [Gemmatimonadota bacterium]|nr:MAG: methylmalonyl-CoA epimerase [Gemmatimonadota bacterium]
MFKKIAHIGVAVKDLEKAKHLFSDIFGLELLNEEVIDEYQLRLADLRLGDVEIELLEGLSDHSTITKFIEKRGEGIQHICFEVDDIHAALGTLTEKGVDLIDRNPRVVRQGRKIAFLRPLDTHGVLIELVEKQK